MFLFHSKFNSCFVDLRELETPWCNLGEEEPFSPSFFEKVSQWLVGSPKGFDPKTGLPLPNSRFQVQTSLYSKEHQTISRGYVTERALAKLVPTLPRLPRIEGGLKMCPKHVAPWWAPIFESGEDFAYCGCHNLPLVTEIARICSAACITARTGSLVRIETGEPNYTPKPCCAEVYVRTSESWDWKLKLVDFCSEDTANKLAYGSYRVDMSFTFWWEAVRRLGLSARWFISGTRGQRVWAKL